MPAAASTPSELLSGRPSTHTACRNGRDCLGRRRNLHTAGRRLALAHRELRRRGHRRITQPLFEYQERGRRGRAAPSRNERGRCLAAGPASFALSAGAVRKLLERRDSFTSSPANGPISTDASPQILPPCPPRSESRAIRSEEHTSELQSRSDLVCRLLLEKKK